MRIFSIKNNIFISDRLVQIHQQESNQVVYLFLVKKTACNFYFCGMNPRHLHGNCSKKLETLWRKEKRDSGIRPDRRIKPGLEILAQPEASRRPDFFRVN